MEHIFMTKAFPAIRRILMTADAVGGVWTYALDLTRFLAAYGVNVAVATMGRSLSRAQVAEASAIPNLAVFESEYRLEWMEDPWQDVLEAGEWLLELEKKFLPDIVHLNGYAHGALPWVSPKLIVGHSCVISWWKAVKKEQVPAAWDRYRAEIARGLSAADMIVTPSEAMLKALTENYAPFSEGRVIYNGRDPAFFQPQRKESVVLTVGRLWDEAKNLSLIEQVAPKISWPIYAAGENEFSSSGAVRSEKIRLLGALSPGLLAGWYARAPIFVLPARYEPFGLSAVEAGLSGCALILGDIPSLREIWQDAALFVSPDSAADLEQTLKEVIENASLREDLANRSRRRALEFSPRRMALEYYAAYQE
jgi:glycogen synthase